jgi:prevent-host-death family protein
MRGSSSGDTTTAASFDGRGIRDYVEVMKRVGTADLKAHLSEHLRAVRNGEEIVIMDRREPIARVIPFEALDEPLIIEPARGSLADFPWPGAVGGSPIDVLAALADERGDR